MKVSRRELGVLVPMLAAAAAGRPARAQTPVGQAAPSGPARPVLPTRNYLHRQIPYNGNETKKGRRFFMGTTHGGFNLETHETVLGPGVVTHPPHRHVNEEIIIVMDGTVETFVDGKTETVEAGSVIFYASNVLHNLRNVGKGAARYYVIELRGDA